MARFKFIYQLAEIRSGNPFSITTLRIDEGGNEGEGVERFVHIRISFLQRGATTKCRSLRVLRMCTALPLRRKHKTVPLSHDPYRVEEPFCLIEKERG